MPTTSAVAPAAGAATATLPPATLPATGAAGAATPTPFPPTVAPSPSPLPAPTSTPEPRPTPQPYPLEGIDRLLREGVERGDFSGAVAVVLMDGRVIGRAAVGDSFTHQAPGRRSEAPIPMRSETVFDVASLTKLFTATAVAQLAERGQLELDAPAARWLPRTMGGARSAVTIRQLLNHTSGFPAGPGYRRMALRDPDAILRDTPLERAPGGGYTYSDLDYLALGLVVEAASGLPLDEYVRRAIAAPLELSRTGFRPGLDRREIAATEYFVEPSVGRTGLVWGTVHDPLAHSVGGVAGHAGLFSTADDLAAFGQMMLDGGVGRGGRVLERASVEAMTSAQAAIRRGGAVGLGWELGQPWYMGRLSAPTTFGHTGFTGTSLVVSPARKAVVALLANRLHPTPRGEGLSRYRQGVADVASRVQAWTGG